MSSEDDADSSRQRASQLACTEGVLNRTPDAAIVANLGVASYALASVTDRQRNFYCWGSMGLTTSIGLGLALATDEEVVVFEGDGSLLMSLGVLGTIAACNPSNLTIVVWENGVYGTTGRQPVTGIEYADAAQACGLWARKADTVRGFETRYAEALAYDGAAMVVCRVEPVDPAARPPLDFAHVAWRFRDALTDDEGDR
jgi:thiamine pyrophosphate-dependent acetolactate synthase large subunit-like protein